ncbi:hypothetical protein IQ06DRAFT_360420 [Phaeosphaeriaceae sp. SRC1lsM3a]|nr:hypothetical protein IQ06DRAFT_360420 [Stagonospora sp. SRC1lsM3a]
MPPYDDGTRSLTLRYYDPNNLDTLPSSLAKLEDYVTTYVPFDVPMGFSAGAVLAAAYLLQKKSRWQKHSEVGLIGVDTEINVSPYAPIRCAISLANAESLNEMRYVGLDEQQAVTQLPRAYIYRAADNKAPTGAKDLSHICESMTMPISSNSVFQGFCARG